jgi:hypothetical protein
MNRITFLFLALLIGSCIVTVNSRHETRTVITEKSVLTERVNSLQETIRRLELDKARLAAKNSGDDECDSAVDAEVAATAAAGARPAAETLVVKAGAPTAPATAGTLTKAPVAPVSAPVKPTPAPTKTVAVMAPAAASKPVAAAPAVAKSKPSAPVDQDDDPLAVALAKMEAKKK